MSIVVHVSKISLYYELFSDKYEEKSYVDLIFIYVQGIYTNKYSEEDKRAKTKAIT
jgi:hypothetical protein